MPHIFKKMSTHYNKKHFQNYTFYLLFPCSHSWPMHASQSQTHVAPPQYYAALRKKNPPVSQKLLPHIEGLAMLHPAAVYKVLGMGSLPCLCRWSSRTAKCGVGIHHGIFK